MARRVHGNGLPVGGPDDGAWELTGATGTGPAAGQKGDQRSPAVTEELVVWSEMAPGGTDYDVYAQRLFPNLRAQAAPVIVAGGPGNQAHPDVVGNGRNGEWLIVWDEDTTDAGDVLGRRISAALTPRSAVFEVAKGVGIASDPTIARDLLDNDTFLVVFTDDRNGNRDLFGTRITEAGVPRGGPLGGQFEVIKSPEEDYAPSLIYNPARSFTEAREGPRTRNILLWTHDDVADGPDVLGQRLNNNGLVQGGPFDVAAGPGIQAVPSGDLRSLENWLVIWQTDALGNLDIMGVELGVNGVIRRAPRVLATD
jgi:hypothetical protein